MLEVGAGKLALTGNRTELEILDHKASQGIMSYSFFQKQI